MAEKQKVVVVMPAYNAAKTLHMTYAELPHDVVDLVILVDDGSKDETVKIAIGGSGDRRPVVIADRHVEAVRGALRNPAPDFAEPENTQALARNGWGVDTPLLLPSTGAHEAIGLQ